MAQNLIRGKQINQSDLTGVVQNVIDANEFSLNYNGGTGFNIDSVASINISGTTLNIYDTPVNITDDFNLSGLGYFSNALNLNNIDSVVFSGVDINVIGGTVTADNIIYNTGTQTVSGNVVVASGIYAEAVYANNLVYNTGTQNIYGTKTFRNNIFYIVTSGETISISSGSMIRVPFGAPPTTNKDFDINLISYPYSNSYISIGYETDRVGQSINSANSFRELKIWETGGYMTNWIYKMARFGPYGVILSEDSFSKVGIGTSFPTEKLHISGGNLRLDYGTGIFSLSGAEPLSLLNNPLSVVGSGNSYMQLNIQNRATGLFASADLVITANNGTDSSNFINLGINNVGYNDPAFTNGTGLDGYLFIDGGNLDIGTKTAGRAIEFHAGGTTSGSTIARINQSGLNVVSGNLTVNNTGVLLTGQNSFIMPISTSQSNFSLANTMYYFNGIGAGYSTTRSNRTMPILEPCIVKKVLFTLQNDNGAVQAANVTGFFINATKNLTGIIFTAATTVNDGNFYNYTSGNLNIPFAEGDSVVCGIFTTTANSTSIRSIVNAYCYN